MTVDNINVEETVKRAPELVAVEKGLTPAFAVSLEVLLLLISILVYRLGLNSRNSPLSQEINKKPRGCKRGGQQGHVDTIRHRRQGQFGLNGPVPDDNRIEEHFLDLIQISVSTDSIVNFNKDAFERLDFLKTGLKKIGNFRHHHRWISNMNPVFLDSCGEAGNRFPPV